MHHIVLEQIVDLQHPLGDTLVAVVVVVVVVVVVLQPTLELSSHSRPLAIPERCVHRLASLLE
jgi:hypothetical protein